MMVDDANEGFTLAVHCHLLAIKQWEVEICLNLKKKCFYYSFIQLKSNVIR